MVLSCFLYLNIATNDCRLHELPVRFFSFHNIHDTSNVRLWRISSRRLTTFSFFSSHILQYPRKLLIIVMVLSLMVAIAPSAWKTRVLLFMLSFLFCVQYNSIITIIYTWVSYVIQLLYHCIIILSCNIACMHTYRSNYTYSTYLIKNNLVSLCIKFVY